MHAMRAQNKGSKPQRRLARTGIGLLVGAVQVGPDVDAEHAAVPLEEADPVLHRRGLPARSALDPAVDDVGRQPEPRRPVLRQVVAAGPVAPHHHVVARRLGRPRRHPEPQRRLERHLRVARHHLRLPQPVEAHRLARRPVVVLDGSAAMVGLAEDARPVGVVGVAVVALRVDLLLEAEAPREGPVGRRRPPAGRLVGDLRQERRHLAPPGGVAAVAAERRERVGGAEEGGVVVEAARGAGGVVLVREEGAVQVLRHDRCHVAVAVAREVAVVAVVAVAAVAVVAVAAAAVVGEQAVPPPPRPPRRLRGTGVGDDQHDGQQDGREEQARHCWQLVVSSVQRASCIDREDS
uniref:Uncharacterized protein n=1 Tax=Setaria italica TaxID=4555 RepID=K3Z7K2_SETIT